MVVIRRNKGSLASVAIFATIVFASVPYSDQLISSAYDGHQVFQIQTSDSNHLKTLHQLEDDGFDFWSRISLDDSIDVRVPPQNVEGFKNLLGQVGIRYAVKYNNVSQLLDEAYKDMGLERQSTGFDWKNYRSTAEIHAFLDKTAGNNPNVAEVISIGKTAEGREIKGIRIGYSSKTAKKSYFMDGGIHAREWIAPAVVTWIVNELVQNQTQYQNLLQGMDFYFIPVLNPDGYEYSRSSDRMWRKNRRKLSGTRCVGVDGNRNFGHMWGGKGASKSPCSEGYRGTSAFSELETRAMRDFINNRNADWRIYNAMHSYGQYVLIPWGYDDVDPEDFDELKKLADEAAAAVKSVNGRTYTTGGASKLLGPGAGGSDDWAKGSGNFKYAYTYEVRPNSDRPGFLLPSKEIIPCASEVWAGVLTMAKYINNLR